MTQEEIRTICTRAVEEAISKRDLAAIDELFSPEMAEMHRQATKFWHDHDPEVSYTVDDVIVEGNRGVVLWSCVERHVGELWGIAPTGKSMTSSGVKIFRVEDGKIVEALTYWTEMDFLKQLGALPQMIVEAMEAFRPSTEASES